MANKLFGNYQPVTAEHQVLLAWLLLNGFGIERVKRIVKKDDKNTFNQSFHKVYGIIEDFVDTAAIEKEIESIRVPTVCSPESFPVYCKERLIFAYTPRIENQPLYINDMGVLSDVMIITEDCVISSNRAKPLADAEQCGFMYFSKYVLESKFTIGRWSVSYIDRIFSVTYTSRNGDVENEIKLMEYKEIEMAATYKFVLYIIRKTIESEKYSADVKMPEDNFRMDGYEKVDEK